MKRSPCQELLGFQANSQRAVRLKGGPGPLRFQPTASFLHSWGPRAPFLPTLRALSCDGSSVAGDHPHAHPPAGQAHLLDFGGGRFSDTAPSCPAMPDPVPRNFD